jgi:hypothetical protein
VHRPEQGCLGLRAIDCVCNSDTSPFLLFPARYMHPLCRYLYPQNFSIVYPLPYLLVSPTSLHQIPQQRWLPCLNTEFSHRPLITLVSRPQLSSPHISRVSHPKTHIHTHHRRSTRNLPFTTETFPFIKLILTSVLHLPFIIDVTARLIKDAQPMRAADSTRFVDYMSGGEFVVCVFGDPGVGGGEWVQAVVGG